MNQSATFTAAEIKTEFSRMTTRELVAYFNILRTPCLKGSGVKETEAVHMPILKDELIMRGAATAIKKAEKANRPLAIKS